MILEAKGINTFYGSSHILFDVSLQVDSAELVCLLGRNGAGKTTTMRSIMGLTPPKTGSVTFYGEEMVGKPPYRIAKKGIGYVPDNRLIFPDLTVRENLEIAIKRSEHFKGEPWTVEKIYEIFPKLKILEKSLGGYLSGGEQQMLTIGRALMSAPELLLLDEPTEGLAPLIVRDLEAQILQLRDAGISILLSEQNIRSAMKLITRAYVIDNGRIRFSGTVDELEANEEVKKKYLMV